MQLGCGWIFGAVDWYIYVWRVTLGEGEICGVLMVLSNKEDYEFRLLWVVLEGTREYEYGDVV
jgi:hypothetical protein